MWAGGAAYTRTHGGALDPIERNTIRRVLEKQGAGKARVADGWGPAELAMLPDTWLEALGSMMGEWGRQGEWPRALRHVIFSMIPEAEAETEAGLRPIGLLPYVYLVWMAIRKGQSQQREWSLGIHDGKHARAATTMAARTRASIEVAQHH